MKHLVKNGQIIISGIPGHFKRRNGQTFWGGYQNMTDLHYPDGWRDEEKPGIDFSFQRYGEPFFDPDLDKVVYPVIDLPFDLEAKQKQLFAELNSHQDDFERLISRCERIYGKNNAGLNEAIDSVLQVRAQTVEAINDLTEETGRTFSIRQEDIDSLKALFNEFKF